MICSKGYKETLSRINTHTTQWQTHYRMAFMVKVIYVYMPFRHKQEPNKRSLAQTTCSNYHCTGRTLIFIS